MANQVFANNMEIACKSASGKSVAAFPDVCFTPPQAPPTPMGIPIPYPNTGLAKDTSRGTRSVKITRKEVMRKNKSFFKTSYGDEPGCAPKKGILTGKIKGKVYFTSWSMNVKVEGLNVVRHMDLTTHNHGSFPGNTPTWPYLDESAISSQSGPCQTEIKNQKESCEGRDPCKDNSCLSANKCMLAPYEAGQKEHPNTYRCCPGTTPHHVVPVQEFSKPGKPRGRPLNESLSKYSEKLAPCICAEGDDHKEYQDTEPYQLKEHGLLGRAYINEREKKGFKNNQSDINYRDLSGCGARSVNSVFPQCSEECIQTQLDNYHLRSAKIPADARVCRASQQSNYSEYKPKTRSM